MQGVGEPSPTIQGVFTKSLYLFAKSRTRGIPGIVHSRTPQTDRAVYLTVLYRQGFSGPASYGLEFPVCRHPFTVHGGSCDVDHGYSPATVFRQEALFPNAKFISPPVLKVFLI